MEENIETNIVEIKYRKPATWRKFMARVIDVIVFGLLFGAFFIPMRAIVSSFSSYKEANNYIETEQIASGLYTKKELGIGKESVKTLKKYGLYKLKDTMGDLAWAWFSLKDDYSA